MKNDFFSRLLAGLKRNFGYKAGAFAVAFLLWVFVMSNQINPIVEKPFTVPVEMRNVPVELALTEQNYQTQVRVKGTNQNISGISARDIEAYVDLADVQAGEVSLEVRIKVPDNIQFVSSTLTSITLTLEETIREDFLLEVIISGVPAANYTILTPVVNPSVVSLSSTGEHMDQVGKVYVSANINDISANYNQHLTVKVEDKDGLDISSLFSIYPATAEVIIGVTYSQPEKYVAIKPVTTGEPAAGFMVSHIIMEPATVRVFSDLAKLEELNFVETVPIDIGGLKNSISQTVNIVLPPGFSLGNKNQVTVFIEIEPISEALFTKKVVNANNLGDDLSVYFDSNNITVIVSGPESFINSLVDADIVLYIDCEGLSPGVYELPLQFLLPPNILLVSADPNIVRVEIK